ncbi:heme a synthase [Janthinobacterium sp. CG_23.3]|uniref:COX15/CtaA family protein n=1 Tax=unclassified Janthinobacterium TaxID=2610881 RepID=UPI00034CF283|nr:MULTISPECIES: COX15/CtaA family protein [unclassified Janthinobacterium]MEC5160953.1 cytochrome c oxidase assembly protein subunit 15 [Janthinobacterium sp. CG_S6]
MHLTLAQLAVTGLLIALLPLAMVWTSSDPHKYRKLVWIAVFLTFDLIMFGAFTRLTDSGLGCPDWPGCYGLANPFLAHQEIRAAEALMPSGPVTLAKAWIEMIHRYLAMAIGVLIVALMAQAWRQWRASRRAEFSPWLPTALFVFVCVQGAFGAWTVTLKLQPLIVTIHLLLGMGLLAMLVWLGARQDSALAPPPPRTGPLPVMRRVRALALFSALLLLVQIALGGWVSTNYATLACTDFPLCAGALVPAMDFEHGFTLWRELGKTAAGHYLPFSALTAIHWVHRSFALLLLLGVGYTAHRAWGHPSLHRLARGIAAVLALQACSGIATIYFDWPLAIAVLHNGGAALLVLLLTMLNYRAKLQLEIARRAASSAAPTQFSPVKHHQ